MILTSAESAQVELSKNINVETLEMLALSGCARSDYDGLIALAKDDSDETASAALTALFYAGGIIGVWDRVAAPTIMRPESPRCVIAAPILALSILRCADVTAFRVLMPIRVEPWEGDVLRAQRSVREAFIDQCDYDRLASGELFDRGRYLLEQISGERFQSTSVGRLLWYLRHFAGVSEVDDVFQSYLRSDYAEIAVTALVGFGGTILSPAELREIPIRGDDALVRVANCASLLFRKTHLRDYLRFLEELSSKYAAGERLSGLIQWTIEAAEGKNMEH